MRPLHADTNPQLEFQPAQQSQPLGMQMAFPGSAGSCTVWDGADAAHSTAALSPAPQDTCDRAEVTDGCPCCPPAPGRVAQAEQGLSWEQLPV